MEYALPHQVLVIPALEGRSRPARMTGVLHKPSPSPVGKPCEFTEEEKLTVEYIITKNISHHPIKVLVVILTCIISVILITHAMGKLVFSEKTSYDWIITDTRESRADDALADAMKQRDLDPYVNGVRRQRSPYGFNFIYESSNNLYVPENLLDMCTVESSIALDENFKKFCLLNRESDCLLPGSSIVVYFYGFESLDQWNCTLLNDSIVNTKRDYLYSEAQTPEGQARFGVWFDKSTLERR